MGRPVPYFERAQARLAWVVPLTLAVIFLLLLVNTGIAVETAIVMLAVPFSLVGAFWLLCARSATTCRVAVWVGIIALAGLDAETGVVMLLYLDLARDAASATGACARAPTSRDAIVEGAVKRIRPKLMTVTTMILRASLPVLWRTAPAPTS